LRLWCHHISDDGEANENNYEIPDQQLERMKPLLDANILIVPYKL